MEQSLEKKREEKEITKNSDLPKKDGLKRDLKNENNQKDLIDKKTVHRPRDNA